MYVLVRLPIRITSHVSRVEKQAQYLHTYKKIMRMSGYPCFLDTFSISQNRPDCTYENY